MEDVVIEKADESPVKVKKAKKKENLKQRAYLNSLSSIIDYGGAQITGFIINPFIVGGLGSSMYGVWQMLSQMTGYAKMADTRATQALKWSISNKRDTAAEAELRSEVTTALAVTAFILPIILIIGGVISWYAPQITQTEPKYHDLIRITCSILIVSLVINKVFDLFESVLSGMNLGYKRMGLRAAIIAIGGVLKVLAITSGYGLIGLSIVQIFVSLITGFTLYYVVKKSIPWFGFGKTNFSKVKSFGKLSGWYMAFTSLKMFLLSSDKIILGYLVGPVYVSKYALTMFTSYAIQGAIVSMITGIIPGIGSLFGKQEFDKVKKARQVIISLAWLFSVSSGVAVLLLNDSFIKMWVGAEHYAGNLENLFILFTSVQIIFFQIDSYIINVTLNMKQKVILSAAATIVTFILAFFLVDQFHILGLCISLLVGRLILTIGYPIILKQKMNDQSSVFSLRMLQPFIVSVVLFVLATYAGQLLSVTNWFYLILLGGVSLAVAGGIFWLVGLGASDKKATWEVVGQVKLFKMK